MPDDYEAHFELDFNDPTGHGRAVSPEIAEDMLGMEFEDAD